ncbi:MAG: DMT family transporter [Flavobacteriaceae bacterium]
MQKNKFKDFLKLHFIVFIWGFTAVLGKLISIEAIPLTWFRITIASIFLFVYLGFKQVSFKISPKKMLHYAIGGFIIGLHWITFFYAIKISNVSITLAAMSTGALFASFLEPIFFKTKLKLYEILLSLIIVIGLIIINKVSPQYGLGILVALFSSFLSALFTVINANFIKNNNASVITFYELLFASLLISIGLLVQNDFSYDFFKLSQNDWLFIGILGTVCTAYALTASTELLKKISPFSIMITVNLEPVYGIILALLVFKDSENMNPAFYYASILILSVVLLNGYIKSKNTSHES